MPSNSGMFDFLFGKKPLKQASGEQATEDKAKADKDFQPAGLDIAKMAQDVAKSKSIGGPPSTPPTEQKTLPNATVAQAPKKKLF